MNRKQRRETQRHQKETIGMMFHPRWLARSIVHSMWARAGATGMNKVKPGTTQSPFAVHWRDEIDTFTSKKNR